MRPSSGSVGRTGETRRVTRRLPVWSGQFSFFWPTASRGPSLESERAQKRHAQPSDGEVQLGQLMEIEAVGGSPARAPERASSSALLRRGRTWMLAAADAVALVAAYAAAYAVAANIAPKAPVAAAPWFLVLVAATAPVVWAGVFTAYHLYGHDNLGISVSSFDEVRDLFHALLAGSLGYLIVSQAVRVFFGWGIYAPAEAVLFLSAALVTVPVARRSSPSWVFPHLMPPPRPPL